MKINCVESYNAGILEAIKILRQQYFAGNLEGGNDSIVLLEQRILPVPDNGVFSVEIPDSVKEVSIEPADLLEKV